MTPFAIAFEAGWIGWAASEVAIFARDRRPAAGERRDRGSRRLVVLAIATGIVGGMAAAIHLRGAALPLPLRWFGLAAMAGSIALRLWAVRTLGRYFRTHVTLLAEHRLVRAGPYRRVRHPSYTGTILTCAGFGLALGNGVALAVLLAVPGVALARRIAVEEAALGERFGAEWAAHRRATWAVLPPVW